MDQPAYTKPPKGVCKRALEEVIPDLIQDQNYNDTTAEFLMNKITQAVALKFKGILSGDFGKVNCYGKPSNIYFWYIRLAGFQ